LCEFWIRNVDLVKYKPKSTTEQPTPHTHILHHSPRKEKKKKNYVGGETPPTSIKEKETLWSKVPYVYPHQVREGREAYLENPTSGFHTTSAGAKNQKHSPTRPKQRGKVHQPTDSGQALTYCSTTAPT